MKRDFKVGDKVKVWGHVCRKGMWYATFWAGERAKVVEVSNGGSKLLIKVRGMKPAVFEVASGQCKLRRFKPKRAPETKEMRYLHFDIMANKYVRGRSPIHGWTVEYIEIKPGQLLVSREDLAKAWDEKVVCPFVKKIIPSDASAAFKGFCKALGFEAQK